MKSNIGDIDRIIRLIVGIVLTAAGLVYGNIWMVVIGIVITSTGIIGWCGLYTLLGISTVRKGNDTPESK